MVGEAPGKIEDQQGKAFVGPSGIRLTEAIRDAGCHTQDFWITNVVRCRPPMNATPTAEQMTICANLYLHREIAIASFHTIILLGAIARSEFFGSLRPDNPEMLPSGIWAWQAPHPMATIHNEALFPELVKVIKNAYNHGSSSSKSSLP